jgi:PAS domain S-box-containing protein
VSQGSDRDSEERQLALLVTHAVDYAIYLIDATGHILTWNPGAERMSGYRAEEVVGRHFATFQTEADTAREHPAEMLRRAARDGRYEEEGWRVRKDGTTFWVGIVLTAIRDEDGELIGFGMVSRDLSERKRAEEERREALEELRVANEELDRFASVAAHDMTDPLRTISGFAELLLQGDPPPEQAREFAGHILTTSLRLSTMLQGLLAYSRAGRTPGERRPVDLGLVAGEVVADMAGVVADRGAEVSVDVPDGATVAADPQDVRLVLQNLLANAVKFGAAGGPVVTIEATRVDGAWSVVVADNGPGIAPEEHARIFRAFERGTAGRGEDGHGLGLAICARVVARHGGTISVDAAPGSGSRFRFTLPALEPTTS